MISLFILLPTALLVILTSLYYYFTRTFDYWKKRNVVGPKPKPIFGNLMESALRKKVISEVLKEVYDSFPNEKVVGIYRMTTPCLLLRDLDVIKQVMVKDFDVFTDRGIEFSKEGLGANLFHADGETWKVLRTRFSPIFTSSKLKNMFHLINERGNKFVDYTSDLCSKQTEQEVYSICQKYTMSTISACAFGIDIDIYAETIETLELIDKKILNINFFNELDMMYPGILKKINTSLFPKAVKDFFFDLVKTVFAQRLGKPTNRNDFMDLLLELKQQKEIQSTKRHDDDSLTLELTESVIAAQAFVFYAAGYETSATTMAFMLYQLALNPEIQDKLITQIDEVLHKNGGEITYDSLNEITYLDKVTHETLRMYSIVDPLQRNVKATYKIPGTNVTLKKDQTVIIPVLGIHRDERYYPNPDKFDPERFSPENSRDRHPCAYLPFGVGPRNCIGMRFAQVQAGVGIVKLLSKFRVEPSKFTNMNLQFDPQRLVNNPLGGIHLNVVSRK